MKKYFLVSFAFLITQAIALAANEPTVKITPLGSHNGEFCRLDRALTIKIMVVIAMPATQMSVFRPIHLI